MTRQELVKRIETVVASEIGATEVRMEDAGTAADVGRWDSMAHARIMLGIEEAFGISIDIGETYKFANFGALFDYVEASRKMSAKATKLTLDEAVAKLKGPALAEMATILPYSIEKLHFEDAFYSGRVKNDEPLAHYERALLKVLETLAPAKAYHEIGGGVGAMAIALGLMGHRAVNIEATTSRLEHGKNILAALAKEEPALADRVKMVCATAPAAFDDLDTDGAVAITTNIASAVDWEHAAKFLKGVQENYAAYIFDLCLLWGVFRTPEAWGSHLERIASLWGRQPELLFEQGGPARYYIVKFDA